MARAPQADPATRAHPGTALRLADGAAVPYPAIMGVLNVTPDSFSDPGRYLDTEAAVARALEMQREGAAIIDIGGESTRPGAALVPVEIECERILPVIRKLKGRLQCPISVDTRKAAVAQRALEAGAAIVNDVSAMTFDPEMAALVTRYRAAVVLMHMRGEPATMQTLAEYDDVVGEVCGYLAQRVAAARAAGIAKSRIILDPGIGFAKKTSHNLRLLACMSRFCQLGYPVLIGVSRKNFIRQIAGPDPESLIFGTAAAVSVAIAAGAAIVRVHDPAPIAAAVKVAAAIGAAANFGN